MNNIHLIQKLKNGKQNLIQKTIKQKTFQKKLLDAKTGEVVIKLGDKINYLNAKKLANDGLKDILSFKRVFIWKIFT